MAIKTNTKSMTNFQALFLAAVAMFCLPEISLGQGDSDGAGQGDAKELRWSLEAGSTYAVELQQTTGIKTNIQSRSQESGNDMLMSMKWLIKSAADDTYTVQQSIDRIKMTVRVTTGDAVQITAIDTDSTEQATEFGDRLLEQIRPLIDAPWTVKMSTRGEIQDVQIPKPTMAALRGAPASMQLRKVISAEGLKDMLGQSAVIFPSEKIKSGHSWDAVATITNPLASIEKKHNYTYNGTTQVDDDTFDNFDISTTITPSNLTAGNAIEKFTGKGKIKFSSTGSNVLVSEIENEMTTSRQYRDQTIRTTVKTNIAMNVTKAAAKKNDDD